MKKTLLSLLTVFALTHNTYANENHIISLPSSDLNWITIPDSGGIKYANVRGDLLSSAYEAFVIFPAGKDNPFHYHSKSIPTVVLRGTFYAIIDGVRTNYPAGSFYDIPGNIKHFSGCAAGPDCLLFQYQKGPFDLMPSKN